MIPSINPNRTDEDPLFCNLCGHVLKDNSHGFDQNDAWIEGDRLVHSGHCTYCKHCRSQV